MPPRPVCPPRFRRPLIPMVLSGDLSRTCITSARLTLRAFTAVDAAESFREANARIARYMSWNPPASETEFRAIWQGTLADMKAGIQLTLVIRITGTNEFVGSAGLHPADGASLETGIWIKESAQRRGYGREAITAVIRWASDTFHPSGFLYPVVDENTPSRRLAEALGAEITGTRQRKKPGDVNRNVLLYCIRAPIQLAD
jgi:RimJ/RimL family protein N-acetyltransferase